MNKTVKWRIAQFFEIMWWKKYLKNKDTAAYLDWKTKYWQGILAQLAPEIDPASATKTLDAGCGPAGIYIALAPHDVTAIDPLLDQYQQNLAHFKRDMYPYVKFETVALEDFKTENTFDLIFCFNAINHVSELKESIANLVKSARSGAKIVLSIDAHNRSFFKHLFRSLPGDILHPHQYDLAEYSQMLVDQGCTILKDVLIKKEFLFNHYALVAQKN